MTLKHATYAIAMAAGRDAANRSAAKAGRESWDDDDLAAAMHMFESLFKQNGAPMSGDVAPTATHHVHD